MAAGVRRNQFIAVERALVRDALRWAPQTLTNAEREWVPPIARDNFDRAIASRNGSIDKDELVRVFTGYAAARARIADRNDNGILSAREARALPDDLKDNFKDAVRVTRGRDWKLAATADLELAGRTALDRYVRRVLFNPNNPEGAAFRSELLDHLTPAQREARRQSMLAEAASWSPAGADWSTGDWDTRTLYAEGRFGGLYTNLFFEKGLALPRVYVEVD